MLFISCRMSLLTPHPYTELRLFHWSNTLQKGSPSVPLSPSTSTPTRTCWSKAARKPMKKVRGEWGRRLFLLVDLLIFVNYVALVFASTSGGSNGQVRGTWATVPQQGFPHEHKQNVCAALHKLQLHSKVYGNPQDNE